jgi:hydroxymethylglutaryl-CoA lyase
MPAPAAEDVRPRRLGDTDSMPTLNIVEVGPRDGLQNEAAVLDPATRIELIGKLAAAGADRIEAVSFVSPSRVPQMAQAEEVMAGVPRRAGLRYAGLVLNDRGLDRALAAGVDEVNVVVVASETFSQRNQGASVAQMLDVAGRVVRRAREAGRFATVTVATAFGCPFEGEMPADRVTGLVARIADSGPDEIALADTIGAGVPAQVRALTDGSRRQAPGIPLRFHFHNTRNTGYANALAALDAGVTTLDAAVGGYGGCPFAPNATGNIGTEDLVYAARRSGFDVRQTEAAAGEIALWLQDRLGKPVQTMLPRAGTFPPAERQLQRRHVGGGDGNSGRPCDGAARPPPGRRARRSRHLRRAPSPLAPGQWFTFDIGQILIYLPVAAHDAAL